MDDEGAVEGASGIMQAAIRKGESQNTEGKEAILSVSMKESRGCAPAQAGGMISPAYT